MAVGLDTLESGSDRTRARILDVALELMATQGFSATSTREMSERLGFTKAALYYHFHTKDDLLGALVAPILDGLAELTGSVPPGVGVSGRRQLLAGYVDLVAAHENLIRVLSEDPSASQRPVVQAAAPIYERLIQSLSGEAEPGTAARARVRAALGGIHSVLLKADPGEDRLLLREAALVAACGALGIPSGRHRSAQVSHTRPA